jgi:hypothetical protein
VLDERYFYEGAKFVVYLVSALPSLLLIAMAFGICVWAPYRLLPLPRRTRAKVVIRQRGQALAAWGTSPVRLGLAGIAISLVVIQFVMRQPFLYSNLLVAQKLPDHWLRALLLTDEEGFRALYFAGLLAATAAPAAIAFVMAGQEGTDGLARALRILLAAVVTIQMLLLPINYSFLITATPLPRVAGLDGVAAAPPGAAAWLAWEGKDGVTYLVRDRASGRDRRSLLTLPRKDVGRIEITGYDPVLRMLFASPSPVACGAAQR